MRIHQLALGVPRNLEFTSKVKTVVTFTVLTLGTLWQETWQRSTSWRMGSGRNGSSAKAAGGNRMNRTRFFPGSVPLAGDRTVARRPVPWPAHLAGVEGVVYKRVHSARLPHRRDFIAGHNATFDRPPRRQRPPTRPIKSAASPVAHFSPGVRLV